MPHRDPIEVLYQEINENFGGHIFSFLLIQRRNRCE